MKFGELGSTGAALMSTFHQLSAGNSGSGPGRAPPWMGPRPTALLDPANKRSPQRTARRIAERRRSRPWGERSVMRISFAQKPDENPRPHRAARREHAKHQSCGKLLIL